jgi:hypothetical protein
MRFIKSIAVFAAAAFLITGCTKNKGLNFANQISSSPNTVDFNNQTEAGALDIIATPTIYTFYAELNSSDKSFPAGNVTISKTNALVTAAGYTVLPDSVYTLLNTTATPDPVTHLAAFQLQINTTKIDLSVTSGFAVAYTITGAPSGAVIATNKNTILISIGAKNKYDGVYSLNLETDGWAAYAIADGIAAVYPYDTYLITSGINNVTLNIPGALGALQPALGGGLGFVSSVSGFGATTPKYFFDNSTNVMTNVINTTPDDGRGRVLVMDPTRTGSHFDPATHNIYQYYTMKQTGRPDLKITQILTYLHSR